MNDFTLVEKLKILMDVILSSPLFLILIICAVIIAVFLIFKLSLDKKRNRIAFISCWVVMLIAIFIKYINIFFELIDNMFNMLFEALYFPSLSTYLIILVISNFFLIYSVIVNTSNISIYDKVTIYSDSKLLVLLELSTSIFTSWILLNLLLSAHSKLKKFDDVNRPELIFDE